MGLIQTTRDGRTEPRTLALCEVVDVLSLREEVHLADHINGLAAELMEGLLQLSVLHVGSLVHHLLASSADTLSGASLRIIPTTPNLHQCRT